MKTKSDPMLGPGMPLTAARAVRILDRLRRNPGVEFILRDDPARNEMNRYRESLGPGVLVRRDGDRILVRARIVGEPSRAPVPFGGDRSGEWLTPREAADRLGLRDIRWFNERYLRSGMIPLHVYGADRFVRAVDVDRVADIRAGGAVVRPQMFGEAPYAPPDYEHGSTDYTTRDTVRRARERVGK